MENNKDFQNNEKKSFDSVNQNENRLTKVLNIPTTNQYSEVKVKKTKKNFIITLIVSLSIMFVVLGIIITISVAIAIKNS